MINGVRLSKKFIFTAFYLLSWSINVYSLPSSELMSSSCNCVCGVRGRSNRIVGGKVSTPHEQPWLAGLWRQGKLYCGATIISRNFLVTAAHCVYSYAPSEIRIYLGGHEISKDYTEIRRIKAIHNHEYFDVVSFNNDIALIELDKPLQYGPRVQPACLPSEGGFDYAGVIGVIAGWGRIGEKKNTSPVLQFVKVPVWSQDQCQDAGYGKNRITDNMMCAGYHDGQYDACQGDSGGPMLHEASSGSVEIIGIVSWGRGCGRPNLPGIYTRVVNYLPWIKRKISNGCLCTRKNAETNYVDYITDRWI